MGDGKINTYAKEIDIMLETKMKELSLLKYRRDHLDKGKRRTVKSTLSLSSKEKP